MKNLCLLLIGLTIIPMLWFSSCAKTEEDNDKIAPVIGIVRFNSNDTINWKGIIIKINDSTFTNRELDTLTIGKVLYLSGKFSSNKDNALSGYKAELWYKSRSKNLKERDDTLKAIGKSIFGMTDADIWNNRLMTIPDSISRTERGKNVQDTTVFYFPIEGDYKVNVVCGDIYGNRDSIQFPVRLLSRKSIYDSRNK
ncbi:MAG: hypothetical protein LBR46_03590 [Prevotella sp.]|jgi:hypothetical protein|nr:hypothetical protein [Prevotella sp.]